MSRKEHRTIGQLIDAHYELQQQKKRLDEQIASIKDSMAALEGEAIEMMESQGLDSGKGSTALGRVEEKSHYNIGDYKKFVNWIRNNNRFELFQNRVSSKAYNELLDAGLKPEGVTIFKEKVFRTTKRKK